MKTDIQTQINNAVETIESAGLSCEVKRSIHETKTGDDGVTLSINIKGGQRPVSVWPCTGTVFSSPVRNKKEDGGGWKFKQTVRMKGLSFEQSVYLAVQVALEGKA